MNEFDTYDFSQDCDDVDFQSLLKKSKDGDSGAQNDLALYYYDGDFVEQDFKKAFYWLTKAADQGEANAQNNLGNFYYNGVGTRKNKKRAAHWYGKAAEKGIVDAQVNIANCYEDGDGVEQDVEMAFYWHSKAAENGHSKGQYNLALCYRYGDATDVNLEKALFWAEKSAAQNNSDAKILVRELKEKIQSESELTQNSVPKSEKPKPEKPKPEKESPSHKGSENTEIVSKEKPYKKNENAKRVPKEKLYKGRLSQYAFQPSVRWFLCISCVVLMVVGVFTFFHNNQTLNALNSLQYYTNNIDDPDRSAAYFESGEKVAEQLRDEWGISDPRTVVDSLPEISSMTNVVMGMLPLFLVLSGLMGVLACLTRFHFLFYAFKFVGLKLSVFVALMYTSAVCAERELIAPLFKYVGLIDAGNPFPKIVDPISSLFRTNDLNSPLYIISVVIIAAAVLAVYSGMDVVEFGFWNRFSKIQLGLRAAYVLVFLPVCWSVCSAVELLKMPEGGMPTLQFAMFASWFTLVYFIIRAKIAEQSDSILHRKSSGANMGFFTRWYLILLPAFVLYCFVMLLAYPVLSFFLNLIFLIPLALFLMPFKFIGRKYDRMAAAKYTPGVFGNCNSMKLGNARCMWCGKSFKIKRFSEVCSEKCRLEFIKPVTVTCTRCGKIYKTEQGRNTGRCADCEYEFAAAAADAYSRGWNSYTPSRSSSSDNMSLPDNNWNTGGSDNSGGARLCPNCGARTDGRDISGYCPNCGRTV